jgi:hypothetical protein
LKYIINEKRARSVRDFLKQYMIHDPHARAEMGYAYPIYSVYLDGPSLDLFNATVCGHKNRFKLRARFYDGKPTSPIFLEIKRRVNDIILKERAPVRKDAFMRLHVGGPPCREDLVDPSDDESFAALQHFCHLQHSIDAKGRTIVAYTREAWNAPDNDDVRVTFDRKIAGSWFDDSLPVQDALRVDRPWVYPPIEGGGPDAVVLELKFTGRYPLWMQELCREFDLYRACMAKYVGCVIALGPGAHGRWRDRRMPPERRETLI